MTEQQLRELFAFDASQAPPAEGLAQRALHRVRSRRRRASVWGSAALVLAVAAGIPALNRWTAPEPSAPVTLPQASPWDGRAGNFHDDSATSCVEEYSAQNVKKRAFAFDGTVLKVGPAITNRPDSGHLPYSGVTFQVHQWFQGGRAQPTVTVDMSGSPAIGTRLLVSGQPRWGGSPLTAPIAWSCGFTRYYDPNTAARWAS